MTAAVVAAIVVWVGARQADSPSPLTADAARAQDVLSDVVVPPAAPPTVTATPTPASVPAQVPTAGSGRFSTAAGGSEVVGSGRRVAYRVEVEDDLPIAAPAFAKAVDKTLGDERGWTTQGYAFQRTPDADLRIVLASPATTDRLCHPLRTNGRVSCRNGNDVVINARRWFDGAKSYPDDVSRYRQYVINHEVGHSFGLGHQTCPANGAKAPVMLQQTLGLQGCEANPWP